MFFIVKKKGDIKYTIQEVSNFMVDVGGRNWNSLNRDKDTFDEVLGQFGRIDYAKIWCDYYNNNINIETVKKLLN